MLQQKSARVNFIELDIDEQEPGIENGYHEPDVIVIDGITFDTVINPTKIESKQVEYLSFPYLPKGHIVGLEGESDLGKSVVLMYIAARVTRGEPLLPGTEASKPGGVIYINFEDKPSDTIKPRLERAGANMSKVRIINLLPDGKGGMSFFSLANSLHMQFLRKLIEQIGAVLIIFDPVTSALGRGVDQNKEADIRNAYAPLMQLVDQLDITAILVRHFKKGRADNRKEQGMGAQAMFNIPRSVISFYPNTEEQSYLVHQKNNLGKKAKALMYHIEGDKTNAGLAVFDGFSDKSNSEIHEQVMGNIGPLQQEILDLLRTEEKTHNRRCMDSDDFIISLVRKEGQWTETNVRSTLSRMYEKRTLGKNKRGSYCLPFEPKAA